jgi:purine-binding chemotaxis protein CheW
VKFRLPETKYDEFTVVIILNVASRVVGVVVDSVSMLSIDPDEIRPTPEFASATFDTKYITGLANHEDGMLIMLDIEKLMTSSDMALVDAAMQ